MGGGNGPPMVTDHGRVEEVLERSVRVHTPLPARPKRRVKPVQRYSPSGSAMTPQTLTSISEARLEQSTSLLSPDVSARSADD